MFSSYYYGILSINDPSKFPISDSLKWENFDNQGVGQVSCRQAGSGGPTRPDDPFCVILTTTQPMAYTDELADPEGSVFSFDYSNCGSKGSHFSSATTRSWAGIRFLSQRSTMMMKRVSTQLTEFKDRVRDWRSRSQTLSFCQSYMRVVFRRTRRQMLDFSDSRSCPRREKSSEHII